MVVTMTIISTGPMTMPQAPNIAMPANTASSISAESRRAARGTRIGRRKLSMFVTTIRWKTITNTPPKTLPNRIIPMPNGIVTMPPPSGMTDSADSRTAKRKKPWWNPAM